MLGTTFKKVTVSYMIDLNLARNDTIFHIILPSLIYIHLIDDIVLR